jgi:hypothetical protein
MQGDIIGANINKLGRGRDIFITLFVLNQPIASLSRRHAVRLGEVFGMSMAQYRTQREWVF